jgi:hypothetical protein
LQDYLSLVDRKIGWYEEALANGGTDPLLR